jgi:hypothetical protein
VEGDAGAVEGGVKYSEGEEGDKRLEDGEEGAEEAGDCGAEECGDKGDVDADEVEERVGDVEEDKVKVGLEDEGDNADLELVCDTGAGEPDRDDVVVVDLTEGEEMDRADLEDEVD